MEISSRKPGPGVVWSSSRELPPPLPPPPAAYICSQFYRICPVKAWLFPGVGWLPRGWEGPGEGRLYFSSSLVFCLENWLLAVITVWRCWHPPLTEDISLSLIYLRASSDNLARCLLFLFAQYSCRLVILITCFITSSVRQQKQPRLVSFLSEIH